MQRTAAQIQAGPGSASGILADAIYDTRARAAHPSTHSAYRARARTPRQPDVLQRTALDRGTDRAVTDTNACGGNWLNDALAIFENLRDYYIRYYETPFSVRDEGVERERHDLLLADKTI